MRLKLYITIIITCCFFSETRAQDPIFTQYFLIPETLNPTFLDLWKQHMQESFTANNGQIWI